MPIQPTTQHDIPALQEVLDRTQLFPSEMLPDMLIGFLTNPEPEDIWLTCTQNDTPIGFCYAAPEELTEGTWNMRAIAVLPQVQDDGHGRALVAALEEALTTRGQRLVIVDTSGSDDFAPTRAFYRQIGYVEEARIQNFWAPDDDKVIFSKALN